MVRIVADSGCNLFEIKDVDFVTVPLTISTAEREFIDDEDLDLSEMLDYLSSYKGKSSTSCPSAQAWLNAYEGADEIFVVTLTSGLSGTYNSAVLAKNMYLEEHPEAKVHVIDSLSVGSEEALIIDRIVELINAGLSFEEIEEKIEAYKKTTRLFFSFASIHNLAENGRINKTVACALGLLNIRITGTASEAGTIEVGAKCRGENRSIDEMISQAVKAGYHGGKFYIHHVENEEGAHRVKKIIEEKYPGAKIEIRNSRGLMGFYAERHGLVLSMEC